MIGSTVAFAVHILVSSFRVLKPVSAVLEYAWPLYRNMATKAVKGSINFDTKHLRKGDPLPPFNGKLRLYNMRYCPFAQRAILALNAKQVDYEVVNITLKDKPEWLTTKSPFGKVPALEIANNVTVYESLVTAEYVDDIYPHRPLVSKDPFKKAIDKIIIEAFAPIQAVCSALLWWKPISEEDIAAYYKALDFIQAQLKSRGTTFLGGNEPGYVDYMIWPWFERILLIDSDKTKIDPPKYSLMAEYLKNMLKDPAVSQYLVPKEALFTVYEGYRAGVVPPYDVMLKK